MVHNVTTRFLIVFIFGASIISLTLYLMFANVSEDKYWLENWDRRQVIAAHAKRHEQALRYLSSLPNLNSITNDSITKSTGIRSNGTLNHTACKNAGSEKHDLIVCFISAKRNKTGFEYLYQSIASFHASARRANLHVRITVAFCGAFIDELVVSKFEHFRVMSTLEDVPSGICKYNQTTRKRSECIERYHYAQILTHLRGHSNLLLLEDDAMSFSYVGSQLKWIFDHRIPQIKFRKPQIIKLFVPYYVQKYPITPHDYVELYAIIYLVFFICTALLNIRESRAIFICLVIVFMCITSGRSAIYEYRRLFQWTFALKPSYRCSTPAVMYLGTEEILPSLINGLLQTSTSPVDMLLHKLTGEYRIYELNLEPNLFWHIGFDSVVTHKRSWKDFTAVPDRLKLD